MPLSENWQKLALEAILEGGKLGVHYSLSGYTEWMPDQMREAIIVALTNYEQSRQAAIAECVRRLSEEGEHMKGCTVLWKDAARWLEAEMAK